MFAQQVGEDISYEKILAPEEGFVGAAKAFFAQKEAIGCNVTMPFKLDAYNFAHVDDAAANDAKAVNTLMKTADGKVSGFNTDGIGLVNDLLNNGVVLKDKHVLLLGAGGAARGVVSPLFTAGINKLTIANRTLSRAEQVAKESQYSEIDVMTLEDVTSITPQIIINSTSASLNGALPCNMSAAFLSKCEAVYDMVYKNSPTPFMQEASKLGVEKSLDGLGMLVEQAAAAFTIWTGAKPDTAEVVNKVREIIKR